MKFQSDGQILVPVDDAAVKFVQNRKNKHYVDIKEMGYSEEQFHSLMEYVELWWRDYRSEKDQTIESFREQISFAVDWTEPLVLRIPKATIFRMLEDLERAKENPTAPITRIIARSWSPSKNNREQLNELAKRVSELGERRIKIGMDYYLAHRAEFFPGRGRRGVSSEK